MYVLAGISHSRIAVQPFASTFAGCVDYLIFLSRRSLKILTNSIISLLIWFHEHFHHPSAPGCYERILLIQLEQDLQSIFRAHSVLQTKLYSQVSIHEFGRNWRCYHHFSLCGFISFFFKCIYLYIYSFIHSFNLFSEFHQSNLINYASTRCRYLEIINKISHTHTHTHTHAHTRTHTRFLLKKLHRLSSIAKNVAKIWKINWILEFNVWSEINKDLIISVTAATTRPLAPFAGICNNMIMYINDLFYSTLSILSVNLFT